MELIYCFNIATVFIIMSFLHSGCSEKKVGDSCRDLYTNTEAKCKKFGECRSAKDDMDNNQVFPTLCTNDFTLVCCRDKDDNTITTVTEQYNKTIEEKLDDTNSSTDKIDTFRHTYANLNNKGDVDTKKNNSTNSHGSQQDSEEKGDRVSVRKCKLFSADVTEVNYGIGLLVDPVNVIKVSTPKCKYQKTQLIVGGEDTELGEFPHMAALGWELKSGGYAFYCGGSLISDKFVLTAAHCSTFALLSLAVHPHPDIVQLGDQNIDPDVEDGANPIKVAIKNILNHPNYHSPKRYDDICLLELERTISFSTYIRPACLWTQHEFNGRDEAIATGWGITNTRTMETSKILQKVSLTLQRNEDCKKPLRFAVNRNWRGFRDSQLCAGELLGKRDTCQGDSGGPLQFASEDNKCLFYLVGVTSFGKKCAQSGQPAVYTRVSSYLDWIESVVWPDEI